MPYSCVSHTEAPPAIGSEFVQARSRISSFVRGNWWLILAPKPQTRPSIKLTGPTFLSPLHQTRPRSSALSNTSGPKRRKIIHCASNQPVLCLSETDLLLVQCSTTYLTTHSTPSRHDVGFSHRKIPESGFQVASGACSAAPSSGFSHV